MGTAQNETDGAFPLADKRRKKKRKKEEKKRYGEDINAIGYINMYLHVVRGDTTRHPCLAVTMMRPPTRTYCTPASSCIASKH